LSAELAGKAVFGKINVDDNPRVSSAFGIQSIPTIIIFKNAQAIDRVIGAMTRTQLISKISPHIERPANSGFNN
jgi:thioredoxin 1